MTAGSFWLRTGTATCIAVALILSVGPRRPPARLDGTAALAAGVAAGTLLFSIATRRVPRLPAIWPRTVLVVAKQTMLGLFAANEEIIWRRVVLGELLPAGALFALAASSTGFALVHRRARLLHLGTGALFGTVYLSTGALVASIAAHWIYNVQVGVLVERLRR